MKSNDPIIKRLLAETELIMPFADFEDMVMKRVYAEKEIAASVNRDKKVSIGFFVAGTLFGVLVNILLQATQYAVADIPANKLLLGFQVLFSGWVLFQGERVFRRSKWLGRA